MPDININPNDVYIYANGAVSGGSTAAVTQENTAISNMLPAIEPEDELVMLDLENGEEYSEEIISLMDTKNGTITGTKQHGVGDCFLLSAVNALSYTEQGQEILANIFEYDEYEGVTTVHLTIGDYTVTDDEWIEAYYNKYSSGDADMIILELAVEKAGKDIAAIQVTNEDGNSAGYNLKNSISNGGPVAAVFCLLGGKYTEYAYTSEPDDITDVLNTIQDGNCAATVSTNISKGETGYVTNLATGGQIELARNHAYAIKCVNGDEVTITNPWNSDEEIVISREELLSNFNNIGFTDLSQDCEVSVVSREEAEKYPEILKYFGAFKLFDVTNVEVNKEFDENGSLQSTSYIFEFGGSTLKEVIQIGKAEDGQTEISNYYQGSSKKLVYAFEEQEDGSAKQLDYWIESFK